MGSGGPSGVGIVDTGVVVTGVVVVVVGCSLVVALNAVGSSESLGSFIKPTYTATTTKMVATAMLGHLIRALRLKNADKAREPARSRRSKTK
jgi:hypothetical protein